MADVISTPAPASHEDHEPLPMQFATAEQRHDVATLGMWTFLLTEILFFGGLFASYSIYRSMYPAAFASTSHFMEVNLGAINTVVLLTSSLTMVLAVRASETNEKRKFLVMLLATVFLGACFLFIKGIEYHTKFVEHHIPGPGFRYEEPQFAFNAQILFFLYFVMTGLHAIHMLVGLGLLTYLLVTAWKRSQLGGAYVGRVEVIGLYWHFVDIVWIFLFPLLYLIGLHQ